MEPVALALLGEPSKRLRHGAEWRYRRKGSLAVHVDGPRRGTWRDHEAGKGGGVLALIEHVNGSDHDAAVQWLKDANLLNGDAPVSPRPRPAPRRNIEDESNVHVARSLWDRAVEVPPDPSHPARRWMAARHLWRPDQELPPSVRWLQGPLGYAVGAVIAAVKPPGSRELSGVHRVHVDADGHKALDRDTEDGGRDKRDFGAISGAFSVLGLASPEDTIMVAEGLADCLALAARVPEPVVFVGGTSGMLNTETSKWLAGFHTVKIWYDAAAKDDGRGLAAASTMAVRIANNGGRAIIVKAGAGAEDPGAAGDEFPQLDAQAVDELRQDFERDGLPPWEAARLATTTVSPLEAPITPTQGFFGPRRDH